MIRLFAKSNVGIILKNISLATILVLGISQVAKAERTNNYQNNLKVACNPSIKYDLSSGCGFSSSEQASLLEENVLAQTRRGRRRKSKVQGYYGGASIGIGFPSGDTADEDNPENEGVDENIVPTYSTGFVGSLFGGIKFTPNLAADLEFLLSIGGIDTDSANEAINSAIVAGGGTGTIDLDGDYSAFGLFVNPRFELPVGQDGKLSVFASPGIGLAQTNINVNAEASDGTNTGASEVDASSTGIAFQIKGGADYDISRTTGIFGQIRYASLPTDDLVDTISLFSAEAGLSFNF